MAEPGSTNNEAVTLTVNGQRHALDLDPRVTLLDALREHLGQNGFDPLMGARPMQRLIQDTLRRALADELLFGKLVDGGTVIVDVDADGKVVLKFGEPGVKSSGKVTGSDREAELVH